jgi:hypothetical protein
VLAVALVMVVVMALAGAGVPHSHLSVFQADGEDDLAAQEILEAA